jgi:hypothetical protein
VLTPAAVGNPPLNFVVSKNLHRRHLNPSQVALIAAEIADAKRGGYRRENERIEISVHPEMTADQAGALMGVSGPMVKRAKTLLKHGTAEEIDAVRQGKGWLRPYVRPAAARTTAVKWT